MSKTLSSLVFANLMWYQLVVLGNGIPSGLSSHMAKNERTRIETQNIPDLMQ